MWYLSKTDMSFPENISRCCRWTVINNQSTNYKVALHWTFSNPVETKVYAITFSKFPVLPYHKKRFLFQVLYNTKNYEELLNFFNLRHKTYMIAVQIQKIINKIIPFLLVPVLPFPDYHELYYKIQARKEVNMTKIVMTLLCTS